MKELTVGLLNIDRTELTLAVLEALSRIPDREWALQVIVVDNGSGCEEFQNLSAGCREHYRDFRQLLFVTTFQNLGGDGGRNMVLTLASAERILFLDNDVVLPEEFSWLETLWSTMDQDPRAGIVGPSLVFADRPEILQGAGAGLTARGRVGYLHRGERVEQVSPTPVAVVASPSACWLVNRRAQRAVGLFSDEFHPAHYEDIDFCVRLGVAGWKIICDRQVRLRHIEHMTTRSLKGTDYARTAVRHAMRFREKWADLLPRIAELDEEDIYWGTAPRSESHTA